MWHFFEPKGITLNRALTNNITLIFRKGIQFKELLWFSTYAELILSSCSEYEIENVYQYQNNIRIQILSLILVKRCSVTTKNLRPFSRNSNFALNLETIFCKPLKKEINNYFILLNYLWCSGIASEIVICLRLLTTHFQATLASNLLNLWLTFT